MRRFRDQLKVALVAIVGALVLGGLLPATALAADNRQGSSVTIGPDEVVNDALYVAAGTIDIEGTVNGNVIAAGNAITISGVVTRDVNASGASISIPGEIQGSARLAGSQVTVTGKVAGDLVTAAGTLTLASEGSVGRDVMAATAMATFAGPIARNVWISGGDVVMSGSVGGNVTAYDSTLRLDSGATIQGSLNYTSNQNANIASGAGVAGGVHHAYPASNSPSLGSYVFGWIQTLVGFFLLGLLLVFAAPRFNTRAVESYRLAPWSRLGIGLAVTLVVPIVAIIAFVLGLIVGGWWLAFFLIGAYALALAAGFVFAGEIVGRFALDRVGQTKAHPIVALMVGLIIVLVLTSLPLIGWLFGLIALVYGVGVVVLAWPSSSPRAPQATAAEAPAAGLGRPVASAG